MRRFILSACVLALLGFASCDGGIGDGSTEGDSTSTVTPSGRLNATEVIVVYDTLDDNDNDDATITIVKRKLLVDGSDKSVLSLDTFRVIGGQNLFDTALQGLKPCDDGLTIFNLYGTDLLLELWKGKSLKYSNGNVLGSPVNPNSQEKLDTIKTRWCTGWDGRSSFDYNENDLLLVVGVPIDGTSYLLAQGHFPEVTSNSILVIDEVGRIRTLR